MTKALLPTTRLASWPIYWSTLSRVLFCLIGIQISLVSAGYAQGPDAKKPITAKYIRANYTKQVAMVPMRDGVKLYTVIYAPKDNAKPHPILLTRTPYGVGPYEPDSMKPWLGPNPEVVRAGYIVAYQDVRGKYMSEGEFVDMRPYKGPHNQVAEIAAARKSPMSSKTAALIDEATDAYDAIDWLVKNVPNNNGRVGTWGISYPGFYSSQSVLDAHPALKAASPQAPVADWWTGDDFRRHGIFLTPHAFNFFSGFGQERPKPTAKGNKGYTHLNPDGYQFFLQAGSTSDLGRSYLTQTIPFWDSLTAHQDYDVYWVARNAIPHFRRVKPAVLIVGGFYDTENLFGALQDYQSIRQNSPETHAYLAMGPWWHGQWARDSGKAIGPVRFGSATSQWYQQNVEFPFFQHYLDGSSNTKNNAEATGARAPISTVHVFEGGSNVWQRYNQWPAHNTRMGKPTTLVKWFPQQSGALRREQQDQPASTASYLADPLHPVPHSAVLSTGLEKEYMLEDQRPNTKRPDVLSFQTQPLMKSLTISGKARVHLKLRSTATDADFFVKVIDVYPDVPEANSNLAPAPIPKSNYHPGGYQQLLRWDAMRARYRNGGANPTPLTPGEATELVIDLNDICHTLLPGHRLMLQVQSSWFPITERHPQQYINVHTASPADYVSATHTLQLADCWLEVAVAE